MFEKEIKFIVDFTLNRLNKLGSFFQFESLASAEIHPAIISYISAQLDYLIYEDRKKLLQNSSFDYSGSEISKYFNLISKEIKKNKRLAFEDVKTLVAHAVTFNINYLVRPNWTLTKLIFSEDKTRNVNEIRMMLNYLYYYDYVRNVFLGYFSKRKIISLSESEFEMILERIDQQMFSSHTRDLIDNALVSIGDFLNEGGLNKTRISTQTVEIFLKEKNLTEALFKLRRSVPAEDRAKYDIEEIRKILYAKEPVKTEPGKEKSDNSEEEEFFQQTAEPETESLPSEDLSVEINTEEEVFDEPENKDEEILSDAEGKQGEKLTEADKEDHLLSESPDDFLTRFESELKSLEELEERLKIPDEKDDYSFGESEEEKAESEEKDISKEEGTSEEKEDSIAEEYFSFEEIMSGESEPEERAPEEHDEPSDRLIIEEEEVNPFDSDEEENKQESVAAPVPPKKNKDILSYMSDKEMERIIANVFNEDEEDFVNTMEKISDSPGYDEATEILKAVFFSYKVSPYSKDAVTLTNAVSHFFDQD